MKLSSLLKNNKIVIMDCAMGTNLVKAGLKVGQQPELMMLTHPNVVENIHQSCVNSGSKVIYTNTFGANREKLSGTGVSVRRVIKTAVELAKKASKGRAVVALSIGPIGRLFQPIGNLTFDNAYDIFKEMAVEGEKAGCDAVAFETFSSLGELRAGVLAVKENTNLEIITTMTFDQSGRTLSGCSPSSFAITIGGLGVTALGVNCSLGPKGLVNVVKELASYTQIPIVAKPNAGLPDQDGNYSMNEKQFAKESVLLAKSGAMMLGGCCGTTPHYIEQLCCALNEFEISTKTKVKQTWLCSEQKTVVLNQPIVIGERLNPTGKKKLKDAYRQKDFSYIVSQAVEQESLGAEILDVNVGVEGEDESVLMQETVKAVSSAVSLPLSIDSSSKLAIEQGLRTFVGKAIVNSVSGEEKSLSTVLPLVKKYGSAVIGLCIDEKGVPKSASERVKIAKRIVKRATMLGIDKADIIIDCLTLTVSAEQSQVQETLKAMVEIKNTLGVKTVLGVSNISYGLPNRDNINSVFLAVALSNGLDFAIINPSSEQCMNAVRSYAVLSGHDQNAQNYLKAQLNNVKENQNDKVSKLEQYSMTELILKALPEVEGKTKDLLKTFSPNEVINDYLIPALDEVGKQYESGKIFLPQLIASAETAKLGFNEVKKCIETSETKLKNKNVIVLATVLGDVHDIGKNIVKIVLENYGYDVIDLGKNVDIKKIVSEVKHTNAMLVGLSALMTTTVGNMEKTIVALNKECPNVKVMVGGAVLTSDYAKRIGANYYAKDASEAVKIAKIVFGKKD